MSREKLISLDRLSAKTPSSVTLFLDKASTASVMNLAQLFIQKRNFARKTAESVNVKMEIMLHTLKLNLILLLT
jgi:hypothetical protein